MLNFDDENETLEWIMMLEVGGEENCEDTISHEIIQYSEFDSEFDEVLIKNLLKINVNQNFKKEVNFEVLSKEYELPIV